MFDQGFATGDGAVVGKASQHDICDEIGKRWSTIGCMKEGRLARYKQELAGAPEGSRMFKRYVLTGTPGCGKTTLLGALRQRGHAVVDEAATEVIARQQHLGCDEPWARDDFIDLIVDLQQERQRAPAPAGVEVQLFDRSPLCTLALARYLDRDVPPALTREVDRMLREHFYQRDVLCLRPLGFITATSARRISYSDSLIFHQVHEEVYREYGFTLVNVAVCGVADRVAIVENQLTTQP